MGQVEEDRLKKSDPMDTFLKYESVYTYIYSPMFMHK